MFNIVKHRYWYFLFSALIVVPGLFSLATHGLPRSIDFTGGTMMELQFETAPEDLEARLEPLFKDNGFAAGPLVAEVSEAPTGAAPTAGEPAAEAAGTRHQIRSRSLSEVAEARGTSQSELQTALYTAMESEFGPFEEIQFTDVGPSVGATVTQNAMIAVMLAAIGILLYLTIMFRNVPHPLRYGVCAILAMLHDVLIVVGLASIMGWLYEWEVDALFLTALLTVIGFSVHDTIVVFDRIREELKLKQKRESYEAIFNSGINKTLGRTLLTGVTTLLVLLAIYLYGGEVLRDFAWVLLVGIVVGTYSSFFVAAPLVVEMHKRAAARDAARASGAAARAAS